MIFQRHGLWFMCECGNDHIDWKGQMACPKCKSREVHLWKGNDNEVPGMEHCIIIWEEEEL